MMHMMNWQVIALTLLGLLVSGHGVLAAGFPEKPVKFIVGFAAGSGVDLEARGIAPYIKKHLGAQVIIENVPGANGKIGITKVWKAKPDGYSVLIHTTTMSIIGQYMLDPEYRIPDFAHVFSWSLTNQVLVVNTEVFKTFDEFMQEARKRPLSAGLPGLGTASHLSGLMLVDGLKIKVNWVPFDGSGEALTALAGKHIDFAAVATTSSLPLVKAGKLTALVVLANEKDIAYPNVPLAKDLGYNFPIMPMLRGADVPPKTPPAVVKKLEDAFVKALKEPEYLAWTQKRMMVIAPLSGTEYGKAILKQQQEVEKYKSFLKY